jgi:hypothetical protein
LDIFAGIDGTGVANNALYDREFANSYVSQLYRSSRFQRRFYTRGPTWDGGTAKAISIAMLREVEARLHQRSSEPVSRIFVAGFSRGGAIAIRVCRELAAHGHKVHCLMLFDAVDMSLAIAAKQVPSNVRYCFHAIRSPQSRSRSSWGNCGTEAQARGDRITLFRKQAFLCTHGAVGGMPWDRADPDGVINEALTSPGVSGSFDRLQNHPAGRIARLTPMGGVAGGILDAADAAHDWHRRSGRTTITLKQDHAESARVGTWMFNRLDWARKQPAAEAIPVG